MTADSASVPVGVIGCGKMGRLHARVCAQTAGVKLVGVHDVSPGAAAGVAGQHGTRAFADLDELLGQVKAAIIAAPTTSHLEIAGRCLRRGIACLIEKPLAGDAESARQIVQWSKEHQTPVQVGHIERFNPAVRAMANLKIQPRFIEVTRVSPLTFRGIDVGVVLDMMIHDIDIVLQLAASPVARVDAVGVGVIDDRVEDICNARLSFENGCVANLTASRLALKTERKLRVFSPDAYLSLDYQKKYAMVARRGENLQAIRDAVAKIKAGQINDLSQLHFADLVNVEELQIDDVEPLRAQLESFIQCLSTGKAPLVSAADGLAAVETARQIVAAMHPQTL